MNNNAFHLIQKDLTYFMTMGSVLLCGDFNARISKVRDFVNIFGRVHEPHELTSRTEFPCNDRFSEDSKVNTYGRELIALCKSI